MEFARVVRKRRMIRAFKAVPVPEAKIRRILELAQHYPSAGFSQGMAFILVTEPERIRRLKEQNRLRGEAPVLVVPCVSEKLYHDRYREPDKIRQDGTEIDWPIPYWFRCGMRLPPSATGRGRRRIVGVPCRCVPA